MNLTRITTAKKVGFKRAMLHRKMERPKQVQSYLKHKSSFLIAAVSLAAFVSGNMVGDHGWYAFFKAVLGNSDDALITYTGTVTPVALVPDYTEWSLYGGNAEEHTYRQVPKESLIPLPAYDQSAAKKGLDGTGIYSVGNMGSYDTGAEGDGSHPGVDIRVPTGTPIRSIANGIVSHVRNDAGGFGLFIVIRHPHVPDPANPRKTTVLHSAYAHLSSQLVKEGDIVEKGQQIGLSGQTGFATGPHLHFQVDRDSAPWHPYWPFTGAEARQAGLTLSQAINSAFHQERLVENTVHPMLLVQSNRSPVNVARSNGESIARVSGRRTREQIAQVRLDRRNQRLARRTTTIAQQVSSVAPVVVEAEKTLAIAEPVIVESSVSSVSSASSASPSTNAVASFQIDHPREFVGREWITIRITLLDETGRKTSQEFLQKDVYLRTAWGSAEFKPAVLKKENFVDGVATVEMLPQGDRTVVIQLQPYAFQSGPIAAKK